MIKKLTLFYLCNRTGISSFKNNIVIIIKAVKIFCKCDSILFKSDVVKLKIWS